MVALELMLWGWEMSGRAQKDMVGGRQVIRLEKTWWGEMSNRAQKNVEVGDEQLCLD